MLNIGYKIAKLRKSWSQADLAEAVDASRDWNATGTAPLSIWPLILMFSQGNSIPQTARYVEKPVYKVYKIDSINNYYLVYAKSIALKYMIVSVKANAKNKHEKILIGGEYRFRLHSRFEQLNEFGDPLLRTQVNCYFYDDSTAICLERKDSIYDLYRANNLKGLYIKL
ncbi:hypothetical protein [Chitinophaga rhizophila]|uniref:HTH cro/C1-type domain-containing protein n=1 Tax=Chitinophaga rhizophila TaxID=2866212 RepID=A0ABS7GDW6_9BACT|nr:hypothetical protein [Chitinophaga rhizophila]MBW8684703.1 hypothetical protein [Chitinophaga rhizophila]